MAAPVEARGGEVRVGAPVREIVVDPASGRVQKLRLGDGSEVVADAYVSAAPVDISLGVLTISDRASAGAYDDLSGPEIVACMSEYAEKAGGGGWRLHAVFNPADLPQGFTAEQVRAHRGAGGSRWLFLTSHVHATCGLRVIACGGSQDD